jgi:hypothetical protein
VNPQWETKGFLPGQSDFGFGPWRAESEKLVASLEPTYAFKTLRIYGDDIRLLKAYPGQWQVRSDLTTAVFLHTMHFNLLYETRANPLLSDFDALRCIF